MKDILEAGFSQMGLSPTPAQIGQLEEYARLLLEQNQVMNLTAITDPIQVARLHFLDSASILIGRAGLEPAPNSWLAGKSVIDVGTGAGFPGLVLKILEPSLQLVLLDSLGKRVSWLKSVCEALSLDGVSCIHARAEEQALLPGFRDSFDVAVSRAVASFPALCELCLPYVKPNGTFWAMKSLDSSLEVESGASAVKALGGKLLPYVDYPIPGADVTHRLVPVRKLTPTPKGLPRSWGKIKRSPL